MSKLVTVVMPARNAAAFIKTSIESILNQTYSNLELIIINDRSTDDTLEIIEQFDDDRIKVLPGNASGISNAFNLALSHAQGDYLSRCDADDIYPHDRIETQVNWLEEHSDYIAVCGVYASIDKKGRHLIQYHRDNESKNIDAEFLEQKTITHYCTFMTRTDSLRAIGGCREFFVTGEDIDLQLRLSGQGKIFFLSKNFYYYRLHDISITHTQSNSHRVFYESVARKCHRQRLLGQNDSVEQGIKMKPDMVMIDEPHNSSTKIFNQLLSQSWYWHKHSNKWRAVLEAAKLIKFYPFRFAAWKNILLIIIK
ncbi:MAG: hypothetical protein CMH22_11465 [Methylophaga sp.]|uniref:glycosyltransferase family 2 protein n=1 Tax=Methylophaga sp. UBA678 TaxID=1946901 RepID=UPI000C4B5E10|nr:glycosyltransferase family A protein [Methylophaga sp. UBA678]MAX52589.1 hypothetical protein [Methylophaga sp.]|tara:strand:- start:33495 stop:34424 length:930 start_codon:yes stop_codon:yes gene_type:complete